MDKLKKYQDLIVEYLTEYAQTVKPANLQGIDSRVIIDKENNSFQLVRIGWNGKQHIFNVVIHFDIINGKVWFQRNNTDREIVDVLIEQGMERQDIVLGFQPPFARGYMGFAVA
jgi:XisI protein